MRCSLRGLGLITGKFPAYQGKRGYALFLVDTAHVAELIGSSTLTVGKTVGQTDGATARSVHAQLGATIAGAVYWSSSWAGTIYPSAHKLRKTGHHDNCTQHVLSKMPSQGGGEGGNGYRMMDWSQKR